MRTTKKKTATLAQVLEYMDGPQAVLLNRGNISKIAGVAIEKGGYTHPLFGAEFFRPMGEVQKRIDGFSLVVYDFAFQSMVHI